MNYYIKKENGKYAVYSIRDGVIKKFRFLCFACKYKTRLKKQDAKNVRNKVKK
ncbi:hypothetical protein [Francisella tularensis]|uniref:hypothetical protein n=1 Tax=Francisella tularensis TaxID=263 RepID=UPI0008F61111|nr:hypothetical protein [Francisella tularensis]APA83256.1 hypothetical protein N894_1272 [Francisella tularensis subsp. novicida PA10-7858]